jgi:DNA replication protein DnaC
MSGNTLSILPPLPWRELAEERYEDWMLRNGFPRTALERIGPQQGYEESRLAYWNGDRGLWIYGNPGAGKTTIATFAARELVLTQSIYRNAKFVTSADYFKLVRDFGSEESQDQVDRYIESPVLVIDDLGKAYEKTDFVIKETENLLRSRYNMGLVTIVTTNLNIAEVERMSKSLASFMNEAFVLMKVVGKDWRSQMRLEI